MPLSDAKCRSAQAGPKLRKLSDAGGLQLWVFPNGSRLWRLAFRSNGKQKLLALGQYPLVTLAKARELQLEAKKQLVEGIDPSAERKQRKSASGAGDTFKAIADEFLAKRRREKAAEATLSKTTWLLEFAYPLIGHLPIRSIKPPEVLEVLREVERRGRYESARRLRSTISAVFRYAIASAKAEIDPTYGLRDSLTKPVVRSRAAVTTADGLVGVLRAIDGFDGHPVTKAALQLMVMLFPRPGELRAARWVEFDLHGGLWIIPADRTKMRREHRVPLPRQAIKLLNDIHPPGDIHAFVFPSVRSVHKCISEGTLNAALRRLGFTKDEVTAHGFRATASTLLNEAGRWNTDAIERQLAHVEANDVRRAYSRGEFWDERVEMMSWWADYLDALRSKKRAQAA
ncbi:MAG: tyrosine-type recombinase/integrase [Parvibaculaceae bacterium]